MTSRYFVKFTIKGIEGVFWTDLKIQSVDKKSIGTIMDQCLSQAKKDASEQLGKKIPVTSIDIESFNLIECVTEIKLTSTP